MERTADLNPDQWKISLSKGVLPQALPENAELNGELCRFTQAHLAKKAIIVDLGCGVGNEARYLKAFGINTICLDGAKKMLDLCDKKLPKVQADLFKLPLASNSVDVVIINHILHLGTYKEAETILEEITRILKPGGSTFISIEKAFPDKSVSEEFLRVLMKCANLKDVQIWLGKGMNSKWMKRFQIYGTGIK